MSDEEIKMISIRLDVKQAISYAEQYLRSGFIDDAKKLRLIWIAQSERIMEVGNYQKIGYSCTSQCLQC